MKLWGQYDNDERRAECTYSRNSSMNNSKNVDDRACKQRKQPMLHIKGVTENKI